MGKAVRERPTRLAEKLLHIRKALGLSQNGLIRRMGLEGEIVQADISTYEIDQREPPLKVLLAYARAANVAVEAVIDDDLNLPEYLPSKAKSEGERRKSAAKGGSRSKR
ncbi:MAG: helix-turn-helix domain-containing protein [Acidobacteriota bacterium]|nr:helix-turn-helix domain-containing protein [Acidobacteriota bacterium]